MHLVSPRSMWPSFPLSQRQCLKGKSNCAICPCRTLQGPPHVSVGIRCRLLPSSQNVLLDGAVLEESSQTVSWDVAKDRVNASVLTGLGFPTFLSIQPFLNPSGRIIQRLLRTVSVYLCIRSFMRQTCIESVCVSDTLQDIEATAESKATTGEAEFWVGFSFECSHLVDNSSFGLEDKKYTNHQGKDFSRKYQSKRDD